MATLDPRHAYVRFYLSVLDDLDGALQAAVAAQAAAREALMPYADVLTAADALLSITTASTALWRPSDPAQFTGLTDIHEVVGRFSFQGEDDGNIAAVGAFCTELREELAGLRAALGALDGAPARAVARADALDARDQASTRDQQADALKLFDPVAGELKTLCGSLLDAVRAVRRPELTRADTAEAMYQDYVSRVGGLYAKALPYLRAELAELSRVAGCEVPPSWPDALPFAPELPTDLVHPATVEGPALVQARAAVEALTAQEAALARTQDELGVQLRRGEGEASSLTQRDAEAARELSVARSVVRWATRMDDADGVRAQASGLQAEALQCGQRVGQIQAEGQRVASQIAAARAEATEWAQGVAARDMAMTRHREGEPALFGKDDWRRKLDDLENEANDARTELSRRQQSLAVLNAGLGQLRAQEQAEQGQMAALARAVEDARSREAAVQREIAEIERELGPARPARRLTVAQAEASLAAITHARGEAAGRNERLAVEARRIREELDRAAVQVKQLAVERQRQEAIVAQAAQQAAAVHSDAARVLSLRRQAAFDSHASAVLAGLEESLSQVERVFIDPARRILLERAGVTSVAPAALRSQAAALTQALPAVQQRADAAFGVIRATLDRIDTAFVQRAAEACRAAWEAPMDNP